MNRDFLSNFEKPKVKASGTAPPENSSNVETDETEYAESGYNRVVCFIWPDGKHYFIDYSRLDSGWMDADQATVRLFFGRDMVDLVGIRLLPLFKSLMDHKRRYIYCDDARYNHLSDEETFVNLIAITQSS